MSPMITVRIRLGFIQHLRNISPTCLDKVFAIYLRSLPRIYQARFRVLRLRIICFIEASVENLLEGSLQPWLELAHPSVLTNIRCMKR